MAICALNQNLLKSRPCGYYLPQVVDIYLANFDDVSATTITADTSGCTTLTAITMATGANFYHIQPVSGSASFENTLVVDDSGAKYRNASLTFNVDGAYDGCKVAALDALSLGRYIAVVKLGDGSYIALNRLSPIEAEVVTLSGGESNGFQVTLSGNTAEAPLPLSTEAIAVVTGA